MKKAVSLLLLLLAAVAQPSFAREKPYAGFDYSSVTFSTSNAEPDYAAIRVKVGSEFSKYVGFEYQGAMGVTHASSTVPGGTIDSRLRGIVGLYLRPKLELGDAFGVYALGGYSWSRLDLDVNIPGRLSKTETADDISGGVGLEMRVFGKSYLNLDYMQYTEGLTAYSAGIRIPF